MKIVIDARMSGLEHAGIGRYVSNLIRAINCQSSAVSNCEATSSAYQQFTLLIRKSKYLEIKKEIGSKFKLVIVEAPHYSLKEQILVPLALLKIKPDLVHFPHFNAPIFWWGKQVVTIHDLIKHESKGQETTTRSGLLYWFKYLNYRFLVWLAVKRAAKVIVPSDYWKKELVQRFKLDPDKIVVTYEGVEKKFKPSTINHQSLAILSKYKIVKPFLIYTGSLYPHKNVERLVETVKQLRLRLSLVIVCSRSVFYERFKKKIKEIKVEKFVNLVGFVPDEDLVELYQEAEAFVFPSLLEGFGLPGLEAMASGCPVVCSDIPVLREIYGEAAKYFDPYDIDDIAEKIKKVTSDKRTSNTLIKKGFEQVKKYSWQRMAEQTLEVYARSTCI